MKNSLKLAVVASAVVLSGSLQAGTLSGNYMATCSGCAISFDSKNETTFCTISAVLFW